MAITLPYEGVLTEDITIDITDAVRKTWTVTINQSDHQTIHVWTPNKTAADKVDHTETFTINDGETIEPEVIADEGYTAGTIAITPPPVTENVINNNVTVDATAATKQIYTIAVTKNETIQNYWLAKSSDVNAQQPAGGSADWIGNGSISWDNTTDKVLWVSLQTANGYDTSSYKVAGLDGLAYSNGAESGYPVFKATNIQLKENLTLAVNANKITIPTGEYHWDAYNSVNTFTIPNNITVLYVVSPDSAGVVVNQGSRKYWISNNAGRNRYIGVTPGKTYTLLMHASIYFYWSPEINKHGLNDSDY